jgi:hypothetical protein
MLSAMNAAARSPAVGSGYAVHALAYMKKK